MGEQHRRRTAAWRGRRPPTRTFTMEVEGDPGALFPLGLSKHEKTAAEMAAVFSTRSCSVTLVAGARNQLYLLLHVHRLVLIR
jgi:hypothetical protein